MLTSEFKRSTKQRINTARFLVREKVVKHTVPELWIHQGRATITVLCNSIETILDDLEAGDRPPMTEGGA